ncbi:MAG: DEAD/DEAH box helicase [Caldilineaceae bacterium]
MDTHELSSIVLPGMSSYSLGELCRQLNITLPQAHRALDDAEAAARLFMHVRERVEQLPRAILRALIECAADSAWGPLILFRDALDISAKETVWSGADLAHIADGMPLAAAVQGHVTHVPPTTVTRAFAADGPLAQLMGNGYEERHGQVDMAQTVLQALNQGGHQIIEAGTGTGKSMAYLLPAALWAQANGQRVVIATGTITLQEQLIDQEILRLAAMTGAGAGRPAQRTQPLSLSASSAHLDQRPRVDTTGIARTGAHFDLVAPHTHWRSQRAFGVRFAGTGAVAVHLLRQPDVYRSALWRPRASRNRRTLVVAAADTGAGFLLDGATTGAERASPGDQPRPAAGGSAKQRAHPTQVRSPDRRRGAPAGRRRHRAVHLPH